MPARVVVTETYWCPGWWPWQWFDTCQRKVAKWCYDFSWIEETGYGFFSYDQGCEYGVLYHWYAFSLFIFGSTYYGGRRMCFDSLLSGGGRCTPRSARPELTEADAARLESHALRRIRGPVRRDLVDSNDEEPNEIS
jgi:hypothetical protein